MQIAKCIADLETTVRTRPNDSESSLLRPWKINTLRAQSRAPRDQLLLPRVPSYESSSVSFERQIAPFLPANRQTIPNQESSITACQICSRLIVKGFLTMTTELRNRPFQIPAKLYRIGELVNYTPFSRQTIHNYTIMGLIRETKWTEGGHRLYDESVFERLSKIMHLKKTKNLTEIRRILCKEQTATKSSSAEQTSSTAGKETGRGLQSV